MDWSAVGKQVALAAPVLGTALAGPVGAAAGALVAAAFGVDAQPDVVAEAVKNDPDAALKLKQIEHSHDEALRAMDIDELKAIFSDVQNARVAFKDHWMPSVITAALFLLVSVVMGCLLFFAVPETNQRVIDLMLGQIIGAFASAIAYWIGTSRGSAVKQSMLAAK